MSDSSREHDAEISAHQAKRQAATLLKSAERDFQCWAKRSGGILGKYLGREPSILSRKELALQQAEALARQGDVLHQVFRMLICIREMMPPAFDLSRR